MKLCFPLLISISIDFLILEKSSCFVQKPGVLISLPARMKSREENYIKYALKNEAIDEQNFQAKKVEADVSGFPEDREWKALTAAQFKRKTVAELSEFLLKRKLKAVDLETGKPLPKATLLATAATYLEAGATQTTLVREIAGCLEKDQALDGGGWEAALACLDAAREKLEPAQRLSPQAFAPLITHARQHLNFEGARELTERMLQECPPEDLIGDRTPADPLDPNLTYLQRAYFLVHSMMTKDEIQPNEDTFRSLLGLCAKSSAWDEAILLLQTAERQGVPPNKFMYDEVLSALEASNLTEVGEVLYERGLTDGMFPEISIEKGGIANLDLHNMTVATAITAVRSVLSDTLHQPSDRLWHTGDKSLMIITGAGKHSEDGVAVIRPAVLDLLNNELKINAELMRYNAGCIEITSTQLKKWKDARFKLKQNENKMKK